ncbi:MAG: DHA2 family efflux MFS transporter permease subunit [Vicinamibacterales bacterium]|nr:DHA2 family efflux MFS transporter permease subunit [Vicinamibacterales bacterium]
MLAGSYAVALNTTVAAMALPAIGEDLDPASGGLGLDWVITSFLVGMILVLPGTAWMTDRWGRVTIYVGSLIVFGTGSAVCAAAPDMYLLVAGRFLQGLGAGALFPVGMTIVNELFPPERRATALGIWGMGLAGAPATGPPLGGWLVTAFGWRWLFVVFVVVAAVAAALAAALLHDSGFRDPRRLDLAGWSLAAVGFVTVIVIAREAPTWGATSPSTLGAVVIAVSTLVALVRRSLRVPQPIIEFRIFLNQTFSITMCVTGLLSIAYLTRVNYLPIELQLVRDMDAQSVGLLLAPSAVGLAVAMTIGGALTDRVGARAPATAGLVMYASSMWQLSHLTPQHSEQFIVGVLIIGDVGTGLAFVATIVVAMNCLPGRHLAQASVMNILARQFSGAIGVAVLGAVLVNHLGAVVPTSTTAATQDAYNRIFAIVFWILVTAAAAALFLPGRSRTGADRMRASEASDHE